ncbi:MAG: NADH:ubiquinone reductase (Na(+)-transporting) subunit C [Prevotellaceae bacterium]|jgi:Na+-transporting NADH:ubiquinone oxidoreductase subunit C|nr:NADH:ubiquinone reductase (Na(+)-transporting) subunit C [Prevotellaceae bacterium]
MNKDGNKYIYLYSIALVVTVAAVLSVAATLLKPFQQKNVEVEKKQSILLSVHKAADVAQAKNKAQYVEEEYARYITGSCVLSSLGVAQEGDAFAVSLEEEMAKPAADRRLPVFICTDSDSTLKYIIPVRGAGLWGPIWGYVALHDDFSTIYGVVFDHQGETPGLGAELSTPEFQRQFAGKQIFDAASAFTSVKVAKGGGTQGRPHEVDAISGGTITSQGIEKMLLDNLSLYLRFFREQQQAKAARQKQENEEKAAAAAPPPAPAARRAPALNPPAAGAAAATPPATAAAPAAADSAPKAAAESENAANDASQNAQQSETQNAQHDASQNAQQSETQNDAG